jgi:hypothetical protein
MKLSALLGAALLAASTVVCAQADRPAAKDARAKAAKACEGKQGAERSACMQREMCAQTKDPKACEERFARAKAAHAKANKACEGRKGTEHRDCMRRELCAQSENPAQCEARAKEAAAKRERIREACKDKKGDDYRACVREQRRESGGKK